MLGFTRADPANSRLALGHLASCSAAHSRKHSMWFLVQVIKGSKHFEAESLVGNRVLISDTTDMVITGRSQGADGYRFEARKGNEAFVVRDFPPNQPATMIAAQFTALAQQIGALAIAGA
jgi:hypothetical protein